MRLRWRKSEYVNLPKRAGVCPDAYAKRHVVNRKMPQVCILCCEVLRGEEG